MSGSGPTKTGRVIVRTGCVVCKARRVKCDERKPTCLRCEKAGKICEGYKNPTKPAQPNAENRALVPRASARRHESSRARTDSLPNLLFQPHSLSQSLFENEHQQRYYSMFYSKTAQQLTGCLGSSLLWDTIVPQACEREPSIRHAVIALGALDFTANIHELMPSSTIDRLEVSEHHAFALREYDKAIKLLREQSSKGNVDVRTAVMFCICCICFESFHGNIDSALAQLYSGINLLCDGVCVKRGNTEEEDPVLTASVVPWIERELILTLRLVGCQGMGFFDPRPISYHEANHKVFQEMIDRMPLAFIDFKEARRYQELVMKRCSHFLHKLVQHDFEFRGTRTEKFAWGFIDPITHPRSYIPPIVFEEHRDHVLELARWTKAFAPLLNHSHTKTQGMDFILATTIKIHSIAMTITMNNALSLVQTSYDASLASFGEIITLTFALLSHPDHSTKKGRFTVHSQYIMALFICALKCRYRAVRKQAISILLQSPQREGLCDSIFVAKLLEWVIGLEEEGMDTNGYIPESSRARSVSAGIDLPNQRAKVTCLMPQLNGELELKEAVVTW